jgi:LicD family
MLILPWAETPPVSGAPLTKTMVDSSKELDQEKHISKTSKSGHHHKQRSRHHHRGRDEHHRRFKSTNPTNSKSIQPAAGTGQQAQAGLAAVGAVAAYGALRGSIKLFHHARRAMLRQVLFDLAPALQNGGHSYWLDFGSLLGVHRDGDLILHDNDIDLAILDPKWDELHSSLSTALPQYSVKLEYPTDADGETTFLRVYCLLGFADVFGAVELDDKRILVDCGHGELNCISTDLVLPTKSIEWRGVKIQVPNDLNGALHARYGPTWKVPRYMDKGADTVEGNKTYARVFRALAKVGIRL